MRPTVTTGDLALSARPATAETFAPFGALLGRGDQVYLGKRGRVLLALDAARPGPRRVTHLQCYPEAKRVLLAVGPAAMWVVVLGAGDRAGGPASAFTLPPGAAVVLRQGVWHAGPLPLEEAAVCELLETRGPADRLDRRSVRDLLGVEALRVLLPEEPGAPAPGLDLEAPNAVMLDSALNGRIRLGCLCFEELELVPAGAALREECDQAVQGLTAMWRHVTDPVEIPGVQGGRDLFREVGIDPEQIPPTSEQLLVRVLAGKPLERRSNLLDVLALCSLRMRVPVSVHDGAPLAAQVLLRTGGAGESYPGRGRNRVTVAGRPVLCDRDGPFGSPVGDAQRTAVSAQTRRAFVVLYLAPSLDAGAVEALLEGVSTAVTKHCSGRLAARLVVG